MAKKNEPPEEHADETWLIPYSDLLTLLLALFIVLFASSQVDAKKFNQMKGVFVSVFMGESGSVIGGDGSGSGSGSGSGTGDGNVIYPSSTNGIVTPSPSAAASEQTAESSAGNVTVNTGSDSGDGVVLDPRMSGLRERFDQYIQNHSLSDKLQTKETDQVIMIVINDVILFDPGKANIKDSFYQNIQSIADIFADNPDLEVQIVGHTDNVPIVNPAYETNWDLSAARALNFMKLLLKDQRLDPSHFSAIGYGEYRPAESNDTSEGRAANRRVEITARFID
ncbi:MAG: OmpA family protein [Clostridiaceae bacterium]|nr:OmpA family protein [Clostridiaceae bacterium]